ncbi:hypothetical protein GIY30_07830 [Gordonia sp. HNM0687]|uniref:Gamma-glutamylcyclotransferase n=1 Tax=Gordonia mangrovi TaxID=2665643 RepID=A0A6L7GNT0_9ACTN|nr:hypothetical protein [Gordonia mangrovi]MXP21262.1 hypothetical protein [Gordonia mangrovi]UVF78211.1 hypothetical protein NWF22_23860 [Gordonia mangrovi]
MSDVDGELTRPSDTAGRHLVVAVGSNASPEVMRTKLARVATGEPGPPMARVTVSHLAVGHSAHVSARGYIPAAPYHAPEATLHAVGAWLTDAEATMLDHTEPNYRRMELSARDHPGIHDTAASFWVYVSLHGVLADPDADPVPLGTQAEIFDWLGTRIADHALRGPTTEVCRRLADPRVGARVSASMRSAGLSRPATLPLPDLETGSAPR